MFIYGLASNVFRYAKIAVIILVLAVLVVSVEAQTYQGKQLHESALPVIYGDTMFKSNTQKALDYLEASYPGDYNNVVAWLSEIRPTDTYTRVNNEGICYINGNDANASYYWLAGVLIHEAQHVNDDAIYFVDNQYTPEESEHRALISQATYLEDISGWTQAQADSWVDGWMAKRYWETIPEKYGQ
jgi:hypothetical protein